MKKFTINKDSSPTKWSEIFRGRDTSDIKCISPEYNGPVENLYIGGELSFINLRRPRVAVVGTRDVSSYGIDCVGWIVDTLATRQDRPIIVSGLAFGVDVKAHVAALNVGLTTVAVMPTGLDEVYPRQNTELARRIVENDGYLITSFPEHTFPEPINFMHRNRLMVKMIDMVIVVESKLKGGAMVIAKLAKDYGIPVLAVPGRIGDVRSAGCNQLIAQHIAEPLVDFEELKSIDIPMP